MKYDLFIDNVNYPVADDGYNWLIARSMEDVFWHIENLGLPEHISFGYEFGDIANHNYSVYPTGSVESVESIFEHEPRATGSTKIKLIIEFVKQYIQ